MKNGTSSSKTTADNKHISVFYNAIMAPAKALMKMLDSATTSAVSGRDRPTVPADALVVAAPEPEAVPAARELLPVVRADEAVVDTAPCKTQNQQTSVISTRG